MSKLTIEVITANPPGYDEDPGLNERKPALSQYLPEERRLKLFLGPKSKLTLDKIRKRVSDVDWKKVSETEVEIDGDALDATESEALYEMIALKSFVFDKYKTSGAERHVQVKRLVFKQKKPDGFNSKLRDEIISGVKFCRDIVSSNADTINAGQMQKFAEDIAENSKQIKCKTINAEQARKKGMNALLAVGAESLKNSVEDFHPRLVQLDFTGSKTTGKTSQGKHIVLVGKGITFDTGGLCLKPTQYMLDMKSDMTGAATVLSVIKVLTKLAGKVSANVKVTGIMALAENAFGASSYKPGDVLKVMNGKTVEVVDTDAEGRLVLADALSYASTLKPDVIIDLATLTGSIVATLGEVAAGAMGDEDLFKELNKAFEKEGEKIWPMPLYDYYKDSLKSEIADIKHCNTRPDALCAGIFLKEFVDKDIDWLHLDIAGLGFIENDGLWAYKGATGFAVKSLVRYILAQ